MHHRFNALLLLSVGWLWLLFMLTACQTEAQTEPAALDALTLQLWGDGQEGIYFREPSGIVFHESRGTLFVVGDEGDLAEYDTNGALIADGLLPNVDLEGITYHPETSLLYAVVEDDKEILEISPDGFEVQRTFLIDQTFNGYLLIPDGSKGIESIVFVADENHAEGGLFFLTYQGDKGNNRDSVLLTVEIPLKSGVAPLSQAAIIAYHEPGIQDLSGLHYDKHNNQFYTVSDKLDTLLVLTMSGEITAKYPLPGQKQEGITIDDNGFIYIADDSGEIIKLK